MNTVGSLLPCWLFAAVLFVPLHVSCAAPQTADPSLVAHWRFDAATNALPDLSGHGHTAQLANVKAVVENGKTVLELDGSQKILVPSASDLNMQSGFSVVAKVKLTGALERLFIVHKDKQYQLRVDQAEEGGSLSFFPWVGGQWEPRVSVIPPQLGAWYHLAATWDGQQAMLWVNGRPHSQPRRGDAPAANDAPLTILSSLPQGGMRGAVEYVKIYRRALSPREIIGEAYGVDDAAARTASASFDFTAGAGLDGWTAQDGAALSLADGRLVVNSKTPQSLAIHNRIRANLDKKDFISLRMTADKGGPASLIYVTTTRAGQLPFKAAGDGKPHTYVFDPWTVAGWGGDLLALGVVPSDTAGNTARIEYLEVGEAPRAAPDIQIDRIFTGSTLPRAGRADRICVRLRNAAGASQPLTAALAPPEGVTLKSPASQPLAVLGYRGETELTWDVEAAQAVKGAFRVSVSGPGLEAPVAAEQTLAFLADPHAPAASYVPVPVPAKTRYALWTHYCALWKHGTHWGWKRIEPWPERQPLLGWYNEGTPEVADWHIKFMVEHGISGVIYCWYRSSVNEPVKQNLGHALDDGFLKARYQAMMKFGIMWENGCAQGVGSTDDLMQNVLPFWIDRYFSHPSYLRFNGRPVLYVWVPSQLRSQLGGSENVRNALNLMRAECGRRGLGGLYLVACAQTQDKPNLETLAKEGWDSTSAYGNCWQEPARVTVEGNHTCAPVEGFIGQQEALWKFKRDLNLLPDVRVAMMGWDPRPWHVKGFFWSENTPEKFRDLCQRAKTSLDGLPGRAGPGTNAVLFCCWNEFGEGHYIEPNRGSGFAYLDAIRDVFCDGPKEHTDVVPQDVGLASPESWYLKARGEVKPGKDTTAWSGPLLSQWSGFADLEMRENVLRGTTTSRDPAVTSPDIELRARRFVRALVEMRLDRPAGHAQLFWTTSASGLSETASVVVPAVGDGQWHTYTFDLARNPDWGGCVTSFRFDPVSEAGVTVEIRSIKLE
ncbi:MAG TPA: glycoside hydrolase family 99-like domain-containing protein [Verrucomicrobiae bacterium]|nr:glycoside hydrolase family 99-like domain-containing protein [Verrucomicrobiae bacterium]